MKQGNQSLPTRQPAQGSASWVAMDSGIDRGMRVLSYLISGVVVYGLLGWLGDHLLGTMFLLPSGIVLGAAMGVYVIIRRYGHDAGTESSPSIPRRRFSRPSQEYVIRRIPR